MFYNDTTNLKRLMHESIYKRALRVQNHFFEKKKGGPGYAQGVKLHTVASSCKIFKKMGKESGECYILFYSGKENKKVDVKDTHGSHGKPFDFLSLCLFVLAFFLYVIHM